VLFADLLAALALGLIMVWGASYVFATKGPWNNLLWFFLVVALFAWAGGIWLVPFGPRWFGIGWMPIFFMALLAVLLVTASSPRGVVSAKKKKQMLADDETKSALDIVFWLLIIFLVLFGTSHYVWNPNVIR
jgi:hypothetical protein